jgi:hypothetical protein
MNPTTRSLIEQAVIFRTLIRHPGDQCRALAIVPSLPCSANCLDPCNAREGDNFLCGGKTICRSTEVKNQMKLLVSKSPEEGLTYGT